jgi:hypothetical protein
MYDILYGSLLGLGKAFVNPPSLIDLFSRLDSDMAYKMGFGIESKRLNKISSNYQASWVSVMTPQNKVQ